MHVFNMFIKKHSLESRVWLSNEDFGTKGRNLVFLCEKLLSPDKIASE